MGYDTTFSKHFLFDKPVTVKLKDTINKFADEYHHPIDGYPGIWCQWIVSEDKDGNSILCWDENEKFYDYVEWLKYLIKHFIEPAGYELNGIVEYQGEEPDDFGFIEVNQNTVTQIFGIHVYDLDDKSITDQMLINKLKSRGYTVIANEF